MEHDERIHRLVLQALPNAHILRVVPLGADSVSHGATAKGAGYGSPIRIDVESGGAERSFVLHPGTANAFGHDRRADRCADAVLAADTFATIERHVRVLDVGAFRGGSEVISLRDAGEFYVLTEWGNGTPYAEDLRAIAERSQALAFDTRRCERLARYLVDLHRVPVERPFARARAMRDLLGSGEGIFGIVDSYPPDTSAAGIERLKKLEMLCLDWRWRMKSIDRPLCRTHGDFHPFNVLFDAGDELVLLDTSRGSCGERADDVTCMALNYVFFALEQPATWGSAFAELWTRFWDVYLDGSGDTGVLDVAAPFLAWRGLVLASPLWYPDLSWEARDRLLAFVELTLRAPRFDPAFAEQVFP